MSEQPESTPFPEIPPPLSPPPEAAASETPSAATETGLSQNACAGLAMLILLVGGVVFYVLERKNAYVRFYSLQSIALGCVAVVVNVLAVISGVILAFIPILGQIIGFLLWLVLMLLGAVFLAVFVISVFKAFTGVEWEVPWLGKHVRAFQKTGKFPFTA